MDFDKKRFAELLDKAKGDRSINKYGLDTGVDPGYISRLLRELIDSRPSADIINKLAKKAHNSVTSIDLLVAAGYISPTDNKVIPLVTPVEHIDSTKESSSDYTDVNIRKISRAAENMTPEQREQWIEIAKVIAPEAFKDK